MITESGVPAPQVQAGGMSSADGVPPSGSGAAEDICHRAPGAVPYDSGALMTLAVNLLLLLLLMMLMPVAMKWMVIGIATPGIVSTRSVIGAMAGKDFSSLFRVRRDQVGPYALELVPLAFGLRPTGDFLEIDLVVPGNQDRL